MSDSRRGAGRQRTRDSLAVVLAAVSLFAACGSPPSGARRHADFPIPDRPVASIVSPARGSEETRDRLGEAERVMDRLGIRPGTRVADVGAGEGYYTVRVARRLGVEGTVYAEDITPKYLDALRARLVRERVGGVTVILGAPGDPKLPPGSVDVAILAHVYHEIVNPYELVYRLHEALAPGAAVAIIDVDKPIEDHGTPPALLRCELAAVGYRQIDFLPLAPADGYLAVFTPPAALPPVSSITPCWQRGAEESTLIGARRGDTRRTRRTSRPGARSALPGWLVDLTPAL